MPRQGRDLERLTEVIERGRKVGVPDVEGFHSKCQGAGVHCGVIVSSRGFAQPALKKAARYNIGCWSLEQAVQFDWCLPVAICVRDLLGADADAVAGDNGGEDTKGATCYYTDGSPLDLEMLRKIGNQCLRGLPVEPSTNGPIKRSFIDRAPAFYAVAANGRRVPIKELLITVTYKVEWRPLEFREYTNRTTGQSIADVATAKAGKGAIEGEVVLMREEGKGPRMAFVSRTGEAEGIPMVTQLEGNQAAFHMEVSTPIPGGHEPLRAGMQQPRPAAAPSAARSKRPRRT